MASETIQTIARLTPLADVLALIDHEVSLVAAGKVGSGVAIGSILAADVTAPTLPKVPIAILDGWALAAYTTQGAGGYSPVLLPAMPQRVEAGQPMPPGTDCVAPVDVLNIASGRAEVLNTINPGDGVLPVGGDCDGSTPLRRAGEVMRLVDGAVVRAAGVSYVSALAPRIIVLPLREDLVIDSIVGLIGSDMVGRGALPELADCGCKLTPALAMENADAIVGVGGTGSGRNDSSVQTLAGAGRVAVHGIALTPGETAAFGFAAEKPVLLLPGRLDAALAVWLTVGRHMLQKLSACSMAAPTETVTLSRKVASTIGLAEVIPLRRTGDMAEPLAAKYLSLTALARSDGWILVPADSEGYATGSQVEFRPWP